MADPVEVERVARAAVALCADLLRRYRDVQEGLTASGFVQAGYEPAEQVEEWGRRVLAWQDQLDSAAPGPLHPEGSTEGHFRPEPQLGQQPPKSIPLAAARPHIVDWDGETREVTCTGRGVDVRYDHGPCPNPAVVGRAEQPSPGPRVWKKGDPEPPEDVVLLRNIGDQADGLPYLRRHDGGWCWVMEATDGPDVNRWPWRLLIAGQVLTEVIQDGANPDGGADG